MREILIATGNPKKYREMAAVLSERGDRAPGGEGSREKIAEQRGIVTRVGVAEVRWLSLDDLARKIEEPHEDGRTFADNARLKARYYARQSGLWTLADDSGLEVDALGDAPGVISARYAASPIGTPRETADAANNRKLMDALCGIPPEGRTARFRCHLALSDGEQTLAEADGVIEGRIIDEPRGAGGFGYDPYFLVPELDRTTAELEPREKNRISHRGRALRLLKDRLLELIEDLDLTGL